MAVPIGTLKDFIVAKAKSRLQVCDGLHELQLATDYISILQAGCYNYVWAYQSNIVIDSDVLEFPEENLVQFGIYARGPYTLTNPVSSQYLGCHGYYLENESAPGEGQTIFVVVDAHMTLTLSGDNKTNVYVMGNGVLTLNMSGQAKSDVRVFNNAQVTATISDGAVLCIYTGDVSHATVTANNTSSIVISSRNDSIVDFTANDTSNSKLTSFTKSIINFTQNDGSIIQAFRYNASQINNLTFLP